MTADEEFAKKLKEFCLAEGYEIAGTCETEGIYGEITIKKISESGSWRGWDENCFNFFFDCPTKGDFT